MLRRVAFERVAPGPQRAGVGRRFSRSSGSRPASLITSVTFAHVQQFAAGNDVALDEVAGIGDFIERYIFPGGELLHVSKVTEVMSDAGLEPLDLENLRPHYARTLWAWSDALEAQLDAARDLTRESVVRAYRVYLAGSAMSFEKGWLCLFQMLASQAERRSRRRPDARRTIAATLSTAPTCTRPTR